MHFFLDCHNYRGIREKFSFYLFKIDDTLNFEDNNVILDLIINGSHHSSIVKRCLLNKAIFRHVKIFIAMTEFNFLLSACLSTIFLLFALCLKKTLFHSFILVF